MIIKGFASTIILLLGMFVLNQQVYCLRSFSNVYQRIRCITTCEKPITPCIQSDSKCQKSYAKCIDSVDPYSCLVTSRSIKLKAIAKCFDEECKPLQQSQANNKQKSRQDKPQKLSRQYLPWNPKRSRGCSQGNNFQQSNRASSESGKAMPGSGDRNLDKCGASGKRGNQQTARRCHKSQNNNSCNKGRQNNPHRANFYRILSS